MNSWLKRASSDRIQREPAPWQCSWAYGRWPMQPRTPPSRSCSSGSSRWSQTKGCHGWWHRYRRQHLQQRVRVHVYHLTAAGLLTQPRSHLAVYWRSLSACSRQRETWGQIWWTCWASWWRQGGHSSWGDTTGPRRDTGKKKAGKSAFWWGVTSSQHTHRHLSVECAIYLDHDVVTRSSLLSFIHPTLHHIIAHLHHVLNTGIVCHKNNNDVMWS